MTQTFFDQINNLKKEASKKRDPLFEPRVFSVSEFYAYINELLGFEEVTIEGEISKIEVSRGYLIYFSLNDSQSVLPCLMFKNKLDALGIPIEGLQTGSRIQVTGYPNIYAKSGTFKLMAQKVSLVGEGALKKAFELLKKRLEAEGLFRQEIKRPIPSYPQRIGLITSKGAAAYTDFVKVLQERWGGLTVYFYSAAVQGESAVEEIVGAFDYFNTMLSDLDVLVLTRGGGSLEDLAAFNAEPIVRAVRASKWPVICAVGHERDQSLAELAADLRASTPSNAAQLLTPTRQEETLYLESLQKKFILHIERALTIEKQQFERALSLMDRFFQRPKTELIAFGEHLEHSLDVWLSRIRHELEQKARLLNSFDPRAVLKRGYSITTTQAGKVIRSIEQVVSNDKVITAVYDGTFMSEVRSKN